MSWRPRVFVWLIRYPVSDYGQKVMACEASREAAQEQAREMLCPGEPYLLDEWEVSQSRAGPTTWTCTVPDWPAEKT